jgi:hypothetical protein
MSYEQQFYLKKNEAEVSETFYNSGKSFWYCGKCFWHCGQKDLERVFAKFGTRIDENTIEFNLLQVMKMLQAMTADLCKIAEAYSIFDEGFYIIQDNEVDYSAERMMLETYALAKMTFKKFADERFETTFYQYVHDENPIDLLVRYIEGITNIVKDMSEDDILVLKIS